MLKKLPLISVVIPVYKAEDCLLELHNRLVMSLLKITSNYEIIFIEDCGGDMSWERIVFLARSNKRVKGIQFTKNFGQHYGISAGLDISCGHWVVVMDCDLQDRPEDILLLYKKALEGYDVVYAKRSNRKGPFFKIYFSILFYKIFSYLADIKYDGDVGNFRLLSRRVVDNFCNIKEQLRFFGGLIDWMAFPAACVNVNHANRFSGKTSYTYKKLWKLAGDTIIAYSDKPLRISIKIGFLISFSSFLIGVILLFKTLFYGSVISGWASLIISFYFLGGIIILILGIIGLYLGKNFEESKKRPLYIIRRSTFD